MCVTLKKPEQKYIDRVKNKKQSVRYQRLLLDQPGALERVLMNLRRRKFDLISFKSQKRDSYLFIDFEVMTDQEEKLNPLLNRLWEVKSADSKNWKRFK